MGDEQGEIDRANKTLALEGDVAYAVVVDEVGDEEGAGDEEGRKHEFFVELHLAVADGGVATGEKNSAGAVEGGVEGGVGEHGVDDGPLLRDELDRISDISDQIAGSEERAIDDLENCEIGERFLLR